MRHMDIYDDTSGADVVAAILVRMAPTWCPIKTHDIQVASAPCFLCGLPTKYLMPGLRYDPYLVTA
jgi:hypothetical protein